MQVVKWPRPVNKPMVPRSAPPKAGEPTFRLRDYKPNAPVVDEARAPDWTRRESPRRKGSKGKVCGLSKGEPQPRIHE
mgnify:FL=1